jgi:hypothetical protein
MTGGRSPVSGRYPSAGHRPLPHHLYLTDPAAGLGQLLEAVP